MEIGHALKLTLTMEGPQKTSYGYHPALGTGDNLDQAIMTSVDNSPSGFNNFYIPQTYSGADQASMQFKH